jgi:MFS family permease
MNHAAAVFAPLIGGLAWYYLGYQVIFFGGVALALLSLGVSQWLDPQGLLAREKLSAVEPAA